MTDTLQTDFPPTRAEGLRRITAFAPKMGSTYSNGRNADLGPDRRHAVSVLSPYLRRRLVSEHEVAGAAIDGHGADRAEKFIQEVIWRTYWKGWLEKRPSVWGDYRDGLAGDRETLAKDRRLARDLRRAEEGDTGIECFDVWAQELVETGYLHNHARMWFASIWIFTLELPWRLGADFFLRHLLDGDPASNTLGWRWVAGIQTKGKNYVATAKNIKTFTDGRFNPTGLAQNPDPLEDDFDAGPAMPVRDVTRLDRSRPAALLITEDDCLPETLGLPLADLAGVATLRLTRERSEDAVSDAIAAFDAGALADAARRAEDHGAPVATPLDHPAPSDFIDWAKGCGVDQIVTAFVPVGPVRDWLDNLAPEMQRAGIALAEIRRDWDEEIWPHATAGFFKVKKQIPSVLKRLY